MKHNKNCLYVECNHCGHEVEIDLQAYGLKSIEQEQKE